MYNEFTGNFFQYQIKEGLDTKFSKFCLKPLKEIFTDRFVEMTWNCHMG